MKRKQSQQRTANSSKKETYLNSPPTCVPAAKSKLSCVLDTQYPQHYCFLWLQLLPSTTDNKTSPHPYSALLLFLFIRCCRRDNLLSLNFPLTARRRRHVFIRVWSFTTECQWSGTFSQSDEVDRYVQSSSSSSSRNMLTQMFCQISAVPMATAHPTSRSYLTVVVSTSTILHPLSTPSSNFQLQAVAQLGAAWSRSKALRSRLDSGTTVST